MPNFVLPNLDSVNHCTSKYLFISILISLLVQWLTESRFGKTKFGFPIEIRSTSSLALLCVCVWVCVCDRMHAMHAITGCPGEIVRSRPRCTPLPPCSDAPGRGAVRCLIWAGGSTLAFSHTLSLSRAFSLSLSRLLARWLSLARTLACCLSLSPSLCR